MMIDTTESTVAGRQAQPTYYHTADMATPVPPNQDDGKHWYASKTIWFNVIVIIASVITAAIPALEPHLTPELYGVLATGVAFVNAVLRLVTGQPIKGRLSE